MNIGNKIKRARLAKGYNGKDFAEKSGISPSFLSEVERNLVDISVKKLINIAKALNTNISNLLLDDELNNEELPYYIVIKDMSAGNDSVGEMWQETKVFNGSTTLDEVMKWAMPYDYEPSNGLYSSSKKRITITRPDQTRPDQTRPKDNEYRKDVSS